MAIFRSNVLYLDGGIRSRASISRASPPWASASKVFAILALVAASCTPTEAREPLVATPLTQSQLVVGFLESYVLPGAVAADLESAARHSAAAALLAVPDLSFQERAASGQDGSMVSLKAALELPLVDPIRALEVALAMNGSSMTDVEVSDERRSALRSFLVLLVQLEHGEDTATQLRDVLTIVRRARPAWLAADNDLDALLLEELEAATDARFALADLRAVERQTRSLRREIAEASGVPSAQTRPISSDLSGLRVRGSDPLDVDDAAALSTCVHTSLPARRARLLAQWRNLTQERDRSSALPSLTLRIEGGLSSSGARGPASGSASLSLSMQIPTWEVMTGALNISASPSGAEQELSLGWPNRYRDPRPSQTVDVEADVAAATDQVHRDLLETLATLADLRSRLAAVEVLELRMEPLWRSRTQGDDMAAIEAAQQRMAASMKRIDLAASIRLYRLDVAHVCGSMASVTSAS